MFDCLPVEYLVRQDFLKLNVLVISDFIQHKGNNVAVFCDVHCVVWYILTNTS
jgi:hypothetical protein